MTENIEVLTHSSIRIEAEEGVIYVDPFQIRGERHDADYIFVTHSHFDHFSPEDIRKVSKEKTTLIVPETIMDEVVQVDDAFDQVCPVDPGRMYQTMDGLSYETVAAYNLTKPFHLKTSEWVGYILILDGKRIYIAGDTDATKEAKEVDCDVALVPIGGTYTMDAVQAAELVNTIRPKVAIPTHYGNVAGSPEDAEVFAGHVDGEIRVEIKKQY